MIPDEPVRGRFAYLEEPRLLGLNGLDQFRLFMEGKAPLAPLYHLAGLKVGVVGPGEASFSMPASPWWRSGAGVFLAGVFPFVADAALGSAIYTTLPVGVALTTQELSMNFLRPATVSSGTLTARARVIQVGRSQGLAECTVEDASGLVLAHGTTRCVIFPLPFEPMAPLDPFPQMEIPSYDTPDPYLRPSEGTVVPHDLLNERSWLDIYRLWEKGEMEAPPFCQLTGLRPVESEEGRAVWAMPATEWLASAFHTFYGGATAMLADAALTSAVGTTISGRATFGTFDLKTYFLRPIQPDGRDLLARARVVHRGKTIGVATAEIEDADGKRVAMATASFLIMPGRRWDEAGAVVPIDEPATAQSDDA